MTEKEKMLEGKLYDSSDKELVSLRAKAHELSAAYNRTLETQTEERAKILQSLVMTAGLPAMLPSAAVSQSVQVQSLVQAV